MKKILDDNKGYYYIIKNPWLLEPEIAEKRRKIRTGELDGIELARFKEMVRRREKKVFDHNIYPRRGVWHDHEKQY